MADHCATVGPLGISVCYSGSFCVVLPREEYLLGWEL
jgi:hypothetical protein